MLISSAKLQFYLSNTGAPARQFELSKVGADCLPLVDLSRREVAIVTSEDVSDVCPSSAANLTTSFKYIDTASAKTLLRSSGKARSTFESGMKEALGSSKLPSSSVSRR